MITFLTILFVLLAVNTVLLLLSVNGGIFSKRKNLSTKGKGSIYRIKEKATLRPSIPHQKPKLHLAE